MIRKILSILLVCLLALNLTACVKEKKEEMQEEGIHLFYPTVLEVSQGGDAISYVVVPWENMKMESRERQANRILQLLMGDCKDEAFVSPIPSGVTLNSCKISGGTALIDFSGGYGLLSGMNLTMADYCVTLSITQIPGIFAARITVNGRELEYRDTHMFLASDVLLSSTEDIVRTLPVSLYYRNLSGELMAEERFLTIYEGESQTSVILKALMAGPENETLENLVPEEFDILNVRTENGVCYLNLPASTIELMPEGEEVQNQMIKALVYTLCSQESIKSVQFLIDGEYGHTLGLVDISGPISPEVNN